MNNHPQTIESVLSILVKLIANSISIFVIIATLLYMCERAMKGQPLLQTQNKQLTLLLIILSFVKSLLNLCYANTVELCTIIRHNEKLV